MNYLLRFILIILSLASACTSVYILFAKHPEIDHYLPLSVMIFAWSLVTLYWFKAKAALQGEMVTVNTRWQRLKIFLLQKTVGFATLIFYSSTLFLLYVSLRVFNYALI